MSHHELNRTIKLIEDADYSLYKWYLQEYDSNGDKVGLEFITQQIGTIRLHIEKLTYIDSFKRSGYDVFINSYFLTTFKSKYKYRSTSISSKGLSKT